MSTCKNCNYAIPTYKYCPNCGQITDVPRITRKMMWRELLRVYLNIDKGLLFTLQQALTRPGLAPKDYVNGKRIIFIKPLTFIAISSALCTAAVQKYPIDFDPYFHVREIPGSLIKFIFWGTILCKIFIKDKRYNFWEVLTLHVFSSFILLSSAALFSFVLPMRIFHYVALALPPVFAMYQAIAYWQFFDLKDNLSRLKGIFVAAILTILVLRMLH
jgi:Protein of unknown function (DUF3667)